MARSKKSESVSVNQVVESVVEVKPQSSQPSNVTPVKMVKFKEAVRFLQKARVTKTEWSTMITDNNVTVSWHSSKGVVEVKENNLDNSIFVPMANIVYIAVGV